MNLPLSFIEYTRQLIGDEACQKLETSLTEVPPVSIRLNTSKPIDVSIQLNKVPWTQQGYYLDERLTFTFDPLFHAGCYYVQEASSMFVEQALRQHAPSSPIKMLDLCAAPGGKSTHARSVLPEGSLLVANEIMRNRSQILAENLVKWGNPDVVVTNNEPADFSNLTSFFDVILTDVPCSGEGMFRKDSVAIDEWSPENVEICWNRQRDIINDIWPSLKPGGILIYSTCTYNTKENEENVRWICDTYNAEVLPVAVDSEWNITSNLLCNEDFPVYRFLPSHTKGEGFFLVVIRKNDEDSGGIKSFSKKTKKRNNQSKKKDVALVNKEHLKQAQGFLHANDNYILKAIDSEIIALPKAYITEIETLQESLKVIQSCLTVAEVKGRDLVPHHALAMSKLYNSKSFDTCDLNYQQAIAYLRKEAIVLSPDIPRGYILLTYKAIPLGFVKNIGNRANNLYPQEWRIRSGYLPDEIKTLF